MNNRRIPLLGLFAFFSSIFISAASADIPTWRGVNDNQWQIIQKLDPTNNCKKRVETIDGADFSSAYKLTLESYLKDNSLLEKALRKNDIVVLSEGVYPIKGFGLRIANNKMLIGIGKVVLDMTQVKKVGSSTHASLQVTGKSAIKNITVFNAPDAGIRLSYGSTAYQVISLDSGRNEAKVSTEGAGFYLKGSEAIDLCVVSAVAAGSYNLIGSNSKTERGGNADGFKVSFGAHNVSIIDGHAYKNSDDGYDFWAAGNPSKKKETAVKIFYSSAIENGIDNGDGEGFKLGGSSGKDYGARLIYGSAACRNQNYGFTYNKTPTKIIVKNLKASGNKKKGFNKISNFNKASWKDTDVLTCKN